MLTQQDRDCIAARGISVATIEHQLALVQRGMPFARLARSCTIHDGITQIPNSKLARLAHTFNDAMAAGRVVKFVPASGAASRMFHALLVCGTDVSGQPRSFPVSPDHASVHAFLSHLSDFAFYEDLSRVLTKQGSRLNDLHAQGTIQPIMEALLHPTGLNYANCPKGILPFHRYADHTRTPIEEHLIEAAAYAKDTNKQARVHFTVAPEHHMAVHEHIESARQRFTHEACDWIVTSSLQHASSETLAVEMDNQPFRDRDGHLLFHPAGHGALLANLHDLQGDLVFIKNIDNVVQDHLKDDMYLYKRALGGYLITIQDTLFGYLRQLEAGTATAQQLDEMMQWVHAALSVTKPPQWKNWDLPQRASYLRQAGNRPVRVCGMVKKTGDPGGGPFWVQHDDDTTSLQIVEFSQVDTRSSVQQHIFGSSTHFNPVDIVCGMRDYQGCPFDLSQFVDPHTGFLSQKSYEGHALKIFELPGLWNGAMAKWHTIFVEVPRSTFHPVKTVLDLLLPAHQPQ